MSNPRIVLVTKKASEHGPSSGPAFGKMLTNMPSSIPVNIVHGIYANCNGTRTRIDVDYADVNFLDVQKLYEFIVRSEINQESDIELIEVIIDQELVDAELTRHSNTLLQSVFPDQ